MSSMVVHLDPEARDEVTRHLECDVVPWAHQQDGLLTGSWQLTSARRGGLGVVALGIEAATETARIALRHDLDPEAPCAIAVGFSDRIATAPAADVS